MATLKPALTITGTAADFGAALSLSVTDSLTVGPPFTGISKLKLVGDAAATTIFENNATTTYVYLKNTDNTNHIKWFNDTDDGVGILWPGEFAFFSVIDAEGLKVSANNADCVLEYGYWTKA